MGEITRTTPAVAKSRSQPSACASSAAWANSLVIKGSSGQSASISSALIVAVPYFSSSALILTSWSGRLVRGETATHQLDDVTADLRNYFFAKTIAAARRNVVKAAVSLKNRNADNGETRTGSNPSPLLRARRDSGASTVLPGTGWRIRNVPALCA